MRYRYFYNISVLLFGIIFLSVGTSIAMAQKQELSNYPAFKFTLNSIELPEVASNMALEVDKIVAVQKHITDSTLQEIQYWNAAYPSHRWHQIMVTAGNQSEHRKNGGRMAVLHLAIYDALAAVWKQKQQKNQKAPFQENKEIHNWSDYNDYSSYICEYSTVAATAHAIIAHYFPDQKEFLNLQLQQFKTTRLQTGLQYPSDIDLGLSIGTQIAAEYIDYARTNRTEKIWKGSVPKDTTLWTGKPSKWDPMKAKWLPLTLEKQDQFRPAPPPQDWIADMEELHEFNKNNKNSSIAWKWQSEPIWDLLLERKILEYGLDPFQAAFASALFHTARYDATIAAWDGKYHYWGIRPFQYDPSFKPILIDTPNFPGYPAGHTTVAGALARVLSHLFPLDTAHFEELAVECSESRFEGGVHFRTDNEVGLKVGEKVGQHVIENFRK